MLITGNGVLIVVEDENDLWSELFNALYGAEPIEDTVAEHALDTICFLQDEDVNVPMDILIDTPMSEGGYGVYPIELDYPFVLQ